MPQGTPLSYGRQGGGWTLLRVSRVYLTGCRGREGVVELLLELGADVEAANGEGETALLWAARKSHSQILDLLHTHGASSQLQDK